METALKALLLSSDDKAVRVLRRVLGELEIEVEHCSELDLAIQRLTRQRFETIIADCATAEIASGILKGARTAPANKRALTVAVIDSQSSQLASQLGAHFVLFKPLSLERTRSSFRSVRALMKRERRRHARIPVEFPIDLSAPDGSRLLQTFTVDLAENGVAIAREGRKLPPSFHVGLTLPGVGAAVHCTGEIAWESKQNVGIRFRDLAEQSREMLKAWIARQLAVIEAADPPVTCKLSDLSLGACYLQTESPFPVRTRLSLTMKVDNLELQIEGIVRVMHPGAGMGVEFTRHTDEQRARVQRFIQLLVNSEAAIPDLQVRPDAIDSSAQFSSADLIEESDDPLLTLFNSRAELAPEQFHAELRKQRGAPEQAGVGA